IFHLHIADTEKATERLRARALRENRLDDMSEEVIGRRLQLYYEETYQTLRYYDPELIYDINASQPPLDVLSDIIHRLSDIQHNPYAWTHRLGRVESEMIFRLDAATDLQRRPDVSFVSYDRWPRGRPVPRSPCWDVVPDLAVEVVSPTNSASGILVKIDEYFRA